MTTKASLASPKNDRLEINQKEHFNKLNLSLKTLDPKILEKSDDLHL